MNRRLMWVSATALISVISVGCTTPSAPPSASPEPTFAGTPEAGGSPYACSQKDYDDMKQKDALYAEAEDVFRRYNAEEEGTYRAGGADKLSAEYRALLGTELLREQQLSIVQSLKSEKEDAQGGEYAVAWVRRLPGKSKLGSTVAVTGCIDLTNVGYYRARHFEMKGVRLTRTIFLGQKPLAILEFVTTVVESC